MLTVVKEFTFDVAHFLPNYKGKCGRVHGHHWVLQVGIEGEVNEQTGMVMDFGIIKDVVQNLVVDKLDHCFLNEINDSEQMKLSTDWSLPAFPSHEPTAENIVSWIVKVLEPLFNGGDQLSFVRLYESPTSYVEWSVERK